MRILPSVWLRLKIKVREVCSYMKALYLVKTNPLKGREGDFNRWYEQVHLDEVLKISGFKSAQRFKLTPEQMQLDQNHTYLTLYEIDSDDVKGTLENLRKATWLQMTDSLDLGSIDVTVVRSLGKKITAP